MLGMRASSTGIAGAWSSTTTTRGESRQKRGQFLPIFVSSGPSVPLRYIFYDAEPKPHARSSGVEICAPAALGQFKHLRLSVLRNAVARVLNLPYEAGRIALQAHDDWLRSVSVFRCVDNQVAHDLPKARGVDSTGEVIGTRIPQVALRKGSGHACKPLAYHRGDVRIARLHGDSLLKRCTAVVE